MDPLSKDFRYAFNILTYKMSEDQFIFCYQKGSKPRNGKLCGEIDRGVKTTMASTKIK